MGILGILATSLVGLVAAGLRMNSASQERVVSTELATALLERIRDDGYLTIPNTALNFDGQVPTPQVDGFPPQPYPQASSAPGHYLNVSTRQVAPNLREVAVTVIAPHSTTRLSSYFHP